MNFILEKLGGEVLVWKESENLLSTVAIVSECEGTQITWGGRRTKLAETGGKFETRFGDVNYWKDREI